jgi:hypothetical protein
VTTPWITEADLAELDAAIEALVDVAFNHREDGCATCADAPYRCARLTKATEALVRWWELRQLASKAEWFRRRHILAALAALTERRAAE